MKDKAKGINELEKYKKAGKLDLNKLLEIEKNYELGYYKISEVVPKDIAFKMQTLFDFGFKSSGDKAERLSMERILSLLIEHPELLNKQLSEVQILNSYLSMPVKFAEKRVKLHKEVTKIQAKNLLDNMIETFSNLVHKDDDEFKP